MKVTPAALSEDELGAISALHGRCFERGWSASEVKALLTSSGCFALVWSDAPELAGFVIARVAADEAEIVSLAVAQARRLRGVGMALVAAAAASAFDRGARKLFLEVSTTNAAALALYRALGFVIVGKRKRYYEGRSGAEDALTLRVELPLAARELGDSPQTR